ncbi:toast rack family protein [Sporosarcina jeotgali]|uniref:Toast rack family protein n=1 Tax=Sporosarcina jeotgali TaxID=3020056 RepID=A0ABZ0KX16_9BACL|nr:toast rack family protein [Sporosarcina sp. B2O-1]WOV83892.1 toast rack family protein [Sporosarcina sp. B2O-1]
MRKIIVVIMAVGILGAAGVWGYNWFFSENRVSDILIEKDDVKSLNANIQTGYGDVTIKDGQDAWIRGTVDTNKKKLRPTVSYKKKGTVGTADIKQKGKMLSGLGNVRNDWNLQLTNEVPVNLNIEMGVSDSTLNLSGIQLSQLSIDAGVSDATIDLSGDWKDSFKADIDLGVGDATILLPADTGVKLFVSKGITDLETKGFTSQGKGIYVNDAYASSDVMIDMKVDVGVGDLKFKLVN